MLLSLGRAWIKGGGDASKSLYSFVSYKTFELVQNISYVFNEGETYSLVCTSGGHVYMYIYLMKIFKLILTENPGDLKSETKRKEKKSNLSLQN